MAVDRRLASLVIAAAVLAGGAGAASGAQEIPGPIPAEVTEIYDGDTITVNATIWPDQYVRSMVRVDGIDTPELRGKCEEETRLAQAARARMVQLIGASNRVDLYGVQYGKYAGRVVARVRNAEGVDLAETLVREGFARPYDGGARRGWCG